MAKRPGENRAVLKQAAWFCLGFALIAADAMAADPGATKPAVIVSTDLSKPFHTRSPWRFTATQGRAVPDPIIGGVTGDKVPGDILVCLRRRGGPCETALQATLRPPSPNDYFVVPHYLDTAQIVHPRGMSAEPLLVVRMASIMSGDGDQLVRTQVLAYRPTSDRFARIYDFVSGQNNNQEVRYIRSGRLRGDIISVEPTENAPYGFRVTVNTLAPDYSYRQILHYQSATRYGDSNTLAVIDSEMTNIEQRLGLWRPGDSLPLPASPCPRPRLVRMELWCK